MLYDAYHQEIYKIILQLHEADLTIDHITINNAIKQLDKAEEIRDALFNIISSNHSYMPQAYHDYLDIIYEKYYRRTIIEEFTPLVDSAYDESVPVNDIISTLNTNIDKYIYIGSNDEDSSAENVIRKTIEYIKLERSGDKKNIWVTGNPMLDNMLYYGPGHISLIGGKGGSGKTRWIIYLLLKMLKFNPDISILWYNMEDSNEKIMRCIMGHYLKLDEDTIRSRRGSLMETQLDKMKELQDMIKLYDIKFNDRSDTIDNIYREFMKFVARRKKRFCILVIDNLMLLEDHSYKRNSTEVDDYISRKISSLLKASNKLSNVGTSIIPVHHFSKDQADKLNVKDAYRPREEHLKGSSRYKDVATQVILINRPDMYKDLLLEYKHIMHIMSRLFITEITKNRDGKTGVIRWFCDLGTTSFKEINKTISHD